MDIQTKGLILVAGATAGFSIKAVFVKIALQAGASIEMILFWRTLIALPFFIGALYIFEGLAGFQINRRLGLRITVSAIFGFLTAIGFSYYALETLPAVIGSLIGYTYPGMTILILFFRGQRPSLIVLSALGLIWLGLYLLIGTGAEATDYNFLGLGLGLASAVAFAWYNTEAAEILKEVSPLKLMTAVFVLVNIGFCPYLALSYPVQPLGQPGLVAALACAGLAIGCSFISMLAFYEGMRLIGPAKAVLINSIGPVYAIVFSFFMLGETLVPIQVIGAGFILTAVVWIRVGPSTVERLRSGKTPRAE